MAAKFVHLHVHSEYSLLDGLPKIKKLLAKTKELGMDSLALTDHGVMYGAIDFYKQAQAEGIKPIVGMEAYTTPLDHKERPQRGESRNNHLLLLAKNEEGYKNLMKITSIAHLEGYYYKPRITRELLRNYSKGLLCTSACMLGEIGQYLIAEDYEKAKETAKWFMDVFGDDYYLEVQRHEYEKHIVTTKDPDIRAEQKQVAGYEKQINEGVIKLSRELGIPIVATNDSHYLDKDDAEAQDVLVCVATGKLVTDTKRIRFVDTPTFYLKSPEEMQALFPDLPEALKNTVKVAGKCNLEISSLGKWFFPKFPLPDNQEPGEYLEKLAHKKLPERVEKVTKEAKERLEYELGIINKKGYAPYFLIVADIVNWANERGIITNTRGSVAGSLVSYVLGITTVDPLRYYLPFDRFLTAYRPTPPDIDLDVADDRREEVIGYMVDKYGKESVAQICTFGRMLARAAVRDVARVLGYPYVTGDRISKQIPPPKQGFPVEIPTAFEKNPILKQIYDTDADAKKILDLAHHVEGSARHISVHAAGVVIAPGKVTDFSPLQLEPSGDKVITQYEFHNCEDVGLIKFDILGIRNLSILGAAVDIVREVLGKEIVLREIPLDDKKTYEMLGRGETMGTFQLSGDGMTRFLKDLKPSKVEDLMAMVALYRPGPMAVIPEYIARKHNPRLVKYLDPRMEKFLKASYGLLVYQDDLLFCALDLAGYTWEEADKFRKAVGKKIPEVMAAEKDKFVKGIVDNGQTLEFAEMLWKLFEPFQSYGFNKAHAASYGVIAYYTAYMKANYPVEYMCAMLTAESNDIDKISAGINEARRMGIKILPPDINESSVGFKIIDDKESLDGRAIRFGLSAIKNVGKAAIEAILESREKGPFTSFGSFLARVDGRRVNKKVIESLIKVGALGKFGARAALLASLEDFKGKTTHKGTDGQQDLFSDEDIKDSMEAVQTETLANVAEFPDEELQSLERSLLGFSLTAKPIAELVARLSPAATHRISEIVNEDLTETGVCIAGVVTEVRVVITKKTGQEMAFVKIDDGSASVDLVVFPKLYTSTRNVWVDYKPVLISGRVDTRQDEKSVIVEKVETEDEVAAEQSKVYIKIPNTITPPQLTKLREILLTSPGDQVVTLVFAGRTDRVNLSFTISWSESLASQISTVLDTNKLH